MAVIAGFWLLSRQEAKLAHDPTHKSFFERNGTSLGIVFICLVTFWMLFLVVLPYLYMVQESFHPRLPPMKRGGPEDFLTIQQYKSFFVEPTGGAWNTNHMLALIFSILTSVFVTVLNFAICYPLAYYMAQAGSIAEGAPADAWPHRALLGERDPARLLACGCCWPPRA